MNLILQRARYDELQKAGDVGSGENDFGILSSGGAIPHSVVGVLADGLRIWF